MRFPTVKKCVSITGIVNTSINIASIIKPIEFVCSTEFLMIYKQKSKQSISICCINPTI